MGITTDEYGLIVNKDGDGGDTANREGVYFFGKLLARTEPFPPELEKTILTVIRRILFLLQAKEGVWVRHPEQWNEPEDFSRDQQTPIVIMIGAYRFKDILWNTFKNHVKRFGKYQNADWAGPVEINIYVRSFHAYFLYPWLLFTDVFLFVSSIIHVVKSFKAGFSDDSVNHTMILLQAKNFMPTPFSWLARKVYYIFRRHPCPTCIEGRYKHPVVAALYYYHATRWGGNVELAELYQPLVEAG